ncbi:hypothetical protein [Xenorhabdus littoralis]|uniref:hypothetical protein n=1 Tax=Xenorhabdus littoralis TaxID=2582835 RepID=UPI0029E7ED30|nr:hypothetical protein [Xenorhabdus sp. psl]MDX7989839.1 hypothetical protein [Xenorhabdus sp. psl]
MKTSLYIIIFIMLFFVFKANSVELIEGKTDYDDIHNEAKNNHFRDNFAQYYNTTFESLNAYDDLDIKVVGKQCMYKIGDEEFSLTPKGKHVESLEDSNAFFGGCAAVSKYVIWEIKLSNNSLESKSCNIKLNTYLPSSGAYFVWQTVVNVDTDNCPFEITAYCNEGNCLNHHVNSSDTNEPNKIAITIKSKNEWNPPKITFPPWGYQVANNYITFTGKGLMKDGNLPDITTNFNEYIYATQFTESAEDWKGQLWIGCGITGAIRIYGVENSDVTFNGPPCGATITSIQDGQIIPAGKYSLSGIVNSDTADDDRRMQVQITGYQNDGTIYSPTKSYTPNVDTGTGKWNLDGLEAVCGINYNASVFINKFEKLPSSQFGLTNLIKSDSSYRTEHCPLQITAPKNYEIVSSTSKEEQDILIEVKVVNGGVINVDMNSLEDGFYSKEWFNQGISGDKWSRKAENVPLGFMKITASKVTDNPISNSSDSVEIEILSTRVFSVKNKQDKVLANFYGTAMPFIEDENFMPEVTISSDQFDFSEEIDPDETGIWKAKSKHYAKRGVYTFKFKETHDNEHYANRDEITMKCTGGDLRMICNKEK